ncbi:Hypothetical protein R9X50_00516600 [Acrodontium crateriforme]|uniref:TLC domain-containing protein n=1 Tax=Acrodontium crateriforme TaxID=150365 RepID=A0AAQ3M6M7_9PEZI|nr:Hypothetical protein R9X50_00516600 [Acrodontium crateriforme]
MAVERRKSAAALLNAAPPGSTGPALSTLDSRHRPSKRRRARSISQKAWRFSLRHTWTIPLVIIICILVLFILNPTPSNRLHKALFVSHLLDVEDPLIPSWAQKLSQTPSYYGKGKSDFAFVAFYTVVFSFTREFIMQRFLLPMAIRSGLRSRSRQSRFCEQMYTALYMSISGVYGLYVMSRTPTWYFNTTGMYEQYPHRAHDAPFKAYYLLQAAYWLQQLLVMVLGLEAKRKDYYELVCHHIVTLALIFLSYRFHFTYIGLAVFISHDISDFFLATSLSLNYVKSQWLQPFYVVFICVWAYMRHYINLSILWSIIAGEYSSVGPYELIWETQQYKSWISQIITFGLLSILQGLNLYWFFLILRIAYNIKFKNVVRDVRSEDDGLDEELEEKKPAPGEVLSVNDSTSKTVVSGIEGKSFNQAPIFPSATSFEQEHRRRSVRHQSRAR